MPYPLGAIQFEQLRAEAQQRLGQRFDVREFHRVVLEDGRLLFGALRSKLSRWMATLERELVRRPAADLRTSPPRTRAMNLNQITLPALDMRASVEFYRNMGFLQIVAAEHYARFECPEGEATFSVHQAAPGAASAGAVTYFECRGLDQKVAELKAKGFAFSSEPTDQRWLWREARLADPSGNPLCLYWAGENRKNPPWRINPA